MNALRSIFLGVLSAGCLLMILPIRLHASVQLTGQTNPTSISGTVSYFDIGTAAGSGTMTIDDGSQVFWNLSPGSSTIGSITGSTGSMVTVTGSNSLLQSTTSGLFIGGSTNGSAGTLIVQNGADVYTLENLSLRKGTISVDGAGSSVAGGQLSVRGVLNVTGGASAAGNNTTGTALSVQSAGIATIDGVGSKLSSTAGSMSVGGAGKIIAKNGGLLSVPSTSIIGVDITNSGTVTIDGAGSKWDNGLSIRLGEGNGMGILNATGGGLVSTGTLVAFGASQVNLDGGTIQLNSSHGAGTGLTKLNLLSAGGTIEIANSTITYSVDGPIQGAGELTKTGPGVLKLKVGSTYLGNTTINAGTLLASNLSGSATGSGNVVVNAGGTLGGIGSIAGTVTVNGGKLAPGESVGTLAVSNATIAGTLAIEYNGDTDIVDLLNVSGNLNITGATLSFANLGSGSLNGGQHVLATYGSRTGYFASILGLPAGYHLDYNYLNGNQIALVPGAPGDFDSDGDVDGADFVAWQTHFPTASGATHATGDADGDGDVDGVDFVSWQTQFPYTPGSVAAPVPEPTTFLLFAMGGIIAVWRHPSARSACASHLSDPCVAAET